MILTVTLNPSVDLALFVDQLELSDTNRVTRTERDAGGKGVNVSRVIAELGGTTTATGFLGGDTGRFIEQVLTRQGVHHDFVPVPGETRTNVSVEDNSGKPPTTLNSPGPEVGALEWERLLEKVGRLATQAKWVTLGGSLPPGVPKDAFKTLAEWARNSGAKVMLDADGDPLKQGLLGSPDFIKPNTKEAARLLGRPIETLEECLTAVEELSKLHPGGIVIISRGAEGAVLGSAEGVLIGTSPKVKAKSSIGSGDSLIAGVLWGLTSGLEVAEAFRYGLAAGAATAMTDGSEIGSKETIYELLSSAVVESA